MISATYWIYLREGGVGKRSGVEYFGGENRCQDQRLYSAKLEKSTGCVCLLMLSVGALCLQMFQRLLRKTRATLPQSSRETTIDV